MSSKTNSGELCFDVKFEEYEHERLDEIYDIVAQYSEMAKNEQYFLNGIIRYFKPEKILEVGIASGGGTVKILNAIKDLPNSHLTSVDYCEKRYGGNTDKLSGYLVDEQFSHLKSKWTVYRGGDISRFIEKIGGDIDMLVLDTAHIHPWETLNFLCVLPFMKRNSWVVLHDINLECMKGREDDLACRYLFSHVVSDAKIMPVSDYEFYFANIGAFRVTDDTVKYVRNLFESLLNPWTAMPEVFDKRVFPDATPMLPEDLQNIKNIINKYYPDYKDYFEHIIETQNLIVKHKTEIHNSFSKKWERNFPWSFRIFDSIYRFTMRTLRKILLGNPSLHNLYRKIKYSIVKH
ncbi:MAG: class I SAM-dependent methyltransferase [Synergistaceae bacterium]|nr:class I SAM-dependent methyltransferase [Synergistaceae bacterium]